MPPACSGSCGKRESGGEWWGVVGRGKGGVVERGKWGEWWGVVGNGGESGGEGRGRVVESVGEWWRVVECDGECFRVI